MDSRDHSTRVAISPKALMAGHGIPDCDACRKDLKALTALGLRRQAATETQPFLEPAPGQGQPNTGPATPSTGYDGSQRDPSGTGSGTGPGALAEQPSTIFPQLSREEDDYTYFPTSRDSQQLPSGIGDHIWSSSGTAA